MLNTLEHTMLNTMLNTLHINLETTHINYIIKKFYTAKNDLAHLLYSNEISINNKVLLCKTVCAQYSFTQLLYGALQPTLTFKKFKPYKINFYAPPVNSPGMSAIKLSITPSKLNQFEKLSKIYLKISLTISQLS